MKRIYTAICIAGLALSGLSGCALAEVAGRIASGQGSPAEESSEAEYAEYEVRYEPNGGTLLSGELLQVVAEGGNAKEPVVEREGYLFAGWDTPSTGITRNLVIVAQWEKAYQITFDPAGGSVAKGEEVQYLAEGESPDIPVVEMEGMQFSGWNPEVGEADRDMVYTAQWSKAEITADELYQACIPSIVEIIVYNSDGKAESLGSGFFIDDEGTVVTNYHVIEGAHSAVIKLSNGRQYDVISVLKYDDESDLAELETAERGNEYLRFAADPCETGQTVYAIGSSLGLTGSLSTGIVSTASRTIENMGDVHYIQHTANISEGNSGSPLLNSYGEVIGVNCMYIQYGQNLNFAIDISELDRMDGGYMTMSDFYEETNYEYNLTQALKEFFSPAQSMEKESNDTVLLSDKLELDRWMAGVLSDADDIDCYYALATSPGRMLFEVVPSFHGQAKEMLCIVTKFSDDELEVCGVLGDSSAYSYQVEKTCTIDNVKAGELYFLLVAYNDDYEFGDGVYYMVKASQ